ncbi:ParB/RepB/Spo0J family partition protein [Phreatobacter sp. AB_2022a]|uniref:ParB/RepB/Spo0J family partition protein n=1 Tax=Phreatobacter sp. AB_2022a TaxID=3003134 RepID=UPI002286F9F9|nr:ParB/RepB/Spo0J family partition protein [Phreatobacter sp. AB_2022a]MCZ0736065.1 ParB/RepB/Spo0J family partition protein [Phreatobacter sp. AB_2022a]
MAEEAVRSRLGRGLAALIGDVGEETAAIDRVRATRRVPIEFVRANPRNPRRVFKDEDLQELADSIRERGIIQPIVVRTVAGAVDAYEIVAGERRWRAAQQAGLHEVPIHLVEVGDREALELAIIENVQRADLNPLEEAMGYNELIEQFGYSQADMAKVIGKSRSHVANTLRLLKLSDRVQSYLRDGQLTAGHARALLAHDDPERVAADIIERGLNVRQVEALAQEQAEQRSGRPPRQRERVEKDTDTKALEKALTDALGMTVTVDHRGSGGELKIRYKSLEQLDEICRRLQR